MKTFYKFFPVFIVLIFTALETACSNGGGDRAQAPAPPPPPGFNDSLKPTSSNFGGAPGPQETVAENLREIDRLVRNTRAMVPGGLAGGGLIPYGSPILGKTDSSDTEGNIKTQNPIIPKNLLKSQGDEKNKFLGTGIADSGSSGSGFVPSLSSTKTEPIDKPTQAPQIALTKNSDGNYSGGGNGGSGGARNEGDHGIQGAAPGNQDYSPSRDPASKNNSPMLSEDPEDYLTRIDPRANLFKLVERKYTEKASLWALQQAHALLPR